MSRLQADMIVARSPRIQARHDRLQRVPATCAAELMPSATIAVEVVFTSVVGMPKIKKGSGYRIPSQIENKSGKLNRRAGHPWFTKIGLGRRIRSKEWPGCFFRGELQRFAGGRRGFEDHLIIILPTNRSSLQKESRGSRRSRQGAEKPSPGKGLWIRPSHQSIWSQGKQIARRGRKGEFQ